MAQAISLQTPSLRRSFSLQNWDPKNSDTMSKAQIECLRHHIHTLESQLVSMKERLADAEEQQRVVGMTEQDDSAPASTRLDLSDSRTPPPTYINPLAAQPLLTNEREETWKWPLKAEEYTRYGRQIIMPEVGLQGRRESQVNTMRH